MECRAGRRFDPIKASSAEGVTSTQADWFHSSQKESGMKQVSRGSIGPILRVLAMALPVIMIALACGPGEQATPTPVATATAVATPTAKPTVAPIATPTPTTTQLGGPVAIPTPTSVAAPAPTPTPGVQPKRGGVLRALSGTYPPSFDGQFLSESTGYAIWLNKVSSNLMVNYEGDKIDCEICSEWHLEDGGKTMVFKLLPGIKFQNGKEMTSADVAYSLNMMLGYVDGITSARCGVLSDYIDAIETPGAYDLRIKLARPSIFVQKILAIGLCVIYPTGTTRADLAKGPVGSGPFVLTKAIRGASMAFERNNSYFKPGLPYLDGVEVTAVPDPISQFAVFLSHKTEVHSSAEVPEQIEAQFDKLIAQGRMSKTGTVPGSSHACYMVTGKPPFDNLKLRQAFNLAIDREGTGAVEYGDKYVQQLFFYSEGQEFALPKEKVWNVVPGFGTGAKKQQEIEQAKQLVKDAGYANGIDVLNIGRSSNWTYQIWSEEVQRQLGKVGIRTKFDLYDTVTHAARLKAYNWQMHCYNYAITTFDFDEIVGQYWKTGGTRNDFAYSNPEVDKLYIQISGELDPAKRKALFYQVQDIVVLKDVAYAPSVTKYGSRFMWDRLQGYTEGFSNSFSSGVFRGDRLWLKD